MTTLDWFAIWLASTMIAIVWMAVATAKDVDD